MTLFVRCTPFKRETRLYYYTECPNELPNIIETTIEKNPTGMTMTPSYQHTTTTTTTTSSIGSGAEPCPRIPIGTTEETTEEESSVTRRLRLPSMMLPTMVRRRRVLYVIVVAAVFLFGATVVAVGLLLVAAGMVLQRGLYDHSSSGWNLRAVPGLVTASSTAPCLVPPPGNGV